MEIFSRLATQNDCRILFEWRNDPQIRNFQFDSSPIEFDSHKQWFADSLASDTRTILIFEDVNQVRVGQTRFDKEGQVAKISVIVAPQMRNLGLGTHMIVNACYYYFENFDVKVIVAEVFKQNLASKAAFTKAGFLETEEAEKHFVFELQKLPRDV